MTPIIVIVATISAFAGLELWERKCPGIIQFIVFGSLALGAIWVNS